MATYRSHGENGIESGCGAGVAQATQNKNGTATPGGTPWVEQSLLPVAVKQLLDANASKNEPSISIQDIDVNNVSFNGVVRDIVRNPTHILLQVKDGTGTIEVAAVELDIGTLAYPVHHENIAQPKNP
ncbi:hypothetical protein PtA15_8A217 [Puccinia triticina]|uniref:Replication factor A protein 3 n=1 Tax=Puccinia triticina TaxID=208348 RepID=A0ABY7CSI7_9BASI|nr:uncharacterized protein PtA15_8A217 [Puccinia triticina]WAQ87313.1 hypothetical protein PtA15_8A217 [Puccinia triticina]WAR57167.1 hypothetical protein PtB15_8B214 [Puccinia triticina]